MKELHADPNSKVGAFQVALLAFTICVLAALVVDTVMILPKEISDLIHIVDTFSCAVFFIDFCIRFSRAESKWAFMKWGWIDLITCIPNLEIFRWGRLARVLRVIRLLRGIHSIQHIVTMIFQNKAKGGAVSVVFAAFLLVAFSSASILVCERHPDSNIKTAEEAVWWCVSTFTTVGYGDKYPITTEGRALGMIVMVAGIGMFGSLSGLAAAFFLGDKEQKSREMEQIMTRLDMLHAKIETMNEERKRAEMSKNSE